MRSFHNDPEIKEKYLSRVKAHQLADEISKGFYWKNGKGCTVGCTIHGSDHVKYETKLGIPRILAKLEDRIFENLPNELAKTWPLAFLEAIKIGSDLSKVWPKFAVWLLIDEVHGVLQYAKLEQARKSLIDLANAYNNYDEITEEKWTSLRINADADTHTANAAFYAASAANDANADYAGNAAANTANAVAVAASTSTKNHWIAQSNKLLELLRECK